MIFEYKIPSRRHRALPAFAQDYRELARLAQVSPSRVAQIVLLAWLAPDLQERILFLSTEEDAWIGESELRRIAREPRWDRQRARFEQLLARRT
jgi:hypothetical protein